MAVLHILEQTTEAPKRYPDIYLVLNVLVSFGSFALAWLWGIKKLVEGAWAIGGLTGTSGKTSVQRKGQ